MSLVDDFNDVLHIDAVLAVLDCESDFMVAFGCEVDGPPLQRFSVLDLPIVCLANSFMVFDMP